MSGPTHTETYKGRRITIYVWPDVASVSQIAMYNILPGSAQKRRIKGAFVIGHLAEDTALQRAKKWIDEQRSAETETGRMITFTRAGGWAR